MSNQTVNFYFKKFMYDVNLKVENFNILKINYNFINLSCCTNNKLNITQIYILIFYIESNKKSIY